MDALLIQAVQIRLLFLLLRAIKKVEDGDLVFRASTSSQTLS